MVLDDRFYKQQRRYRRVKITSDNDSKHVWEKMIEEDKKEFLRCKKCGLYLNILWMFLEEERKRYKDSRTALAEKNIIDQRIHNLMMEELAKWLQF